MSLYFYKAFQLCFASDVPLPGVEVAEAGEADVIIRAGDGPFQVAEPLMDLVCVQSNAREFSLEVKDVLSLYVSAKTVIEGVY